MPDRYYKSSPISFSRPLVGMVVSRAGKNEEEKEYLFRDLLIIIGHFYYMSISSLHLFKTLLTPFFLFMGYYYVCCCYCWILGVNVLLSLWLQLLAYHLTVLRGYNVDQPRNLAKSVTTQ